MKTNEKTCWACKRILIGESKLGLCPACLNKYGSRAAGVGVFIVGVGLNTLRKNAGKIEKGIINVVKNIKLK